MLPSERVAEVAAKLRELGELLPEVTKVEDLDTIRVALQPLLVRLFTNYIIVGFRRLPDENIQGNDREAPSWFAYGDPETSGILAYWLLRDIVKRLNLQGTVEFEDQGKVTRLKMGEFMKKVRKDNTG